MRSVKRRLLSPVLPLALDRNMAFCSAPEMKTSHTIVSLRVNPARLVHHSPRKALLRKADSADDKLRRREG